MPSDARKVKKPRKTQQLFMLRRQEQVADMYFRGFPQHEIAAQLKVTQPTIGADLEKLRERWAKNANEKYEARLYLELAKLDKVEEEAYKGWVKSCVVTTKQKFRRAPSAKDVEAGHNPKHLKTTQEIETTEEKAGDPRFLEIIKDCGTKRMKLLGFLDERPINVNQQVLDWTVLAKPEPKPDPVEEHIKDLESLPKKEPTNG